MKEEFWLGAVSLLIVIFGSIGNVLVIFSLGRQKKLVKKNHHYYLVLHLAICDLACLLFTLSDIYTLFTGKLLAFSTIICKIWAPVQTLFFKMEAQVMVLISIVRFRAVFYPLRVPLGRRKINVALGASWILATLCTSPFFSLLNYSPQFGCYINWPGRTFRIAYTLFLTCVEYLIPLMLVSLAYYKIYSKIRQQSKERKLLQASQTSKEDFKKRTMFEKFKQDQNGRIFLVSCIIVICYAVSAFPFQCLGIITATDIAIPPVYHLISYIFYLVGVCSVNPFIYKVLDTKVFKGIFKAFKKFTSIRGGINTSTQIKLVSKLSTKSEPSFSGIEETAL